MKKTYLAKMLFGKINPKYKYNSSFYSARNINIYEEMLNFKVKSLKGKNVLDIGACNALFQDECKKYRNITVISLDPLYAVDDDPYFIIPGDRKNKFAGINEELPFRNETFDAVLSVCSSFFYLWQNYPNIIHRKKIAKQMFEEVLRVLTPSGEARIGSLTYVNQKLSDEAFFEPILKGIQAEGNFDFVWNFEVNAWRYLVLNKGDKK